jgi:hypothetical protein
MRIGKGKGKERKRKKEDGSRRVQPISLDNLNSLFAVGQNSIASV